MSHALERTSPYGQPFVGTCIKCGQTGLNMGDGLKRCPNDKTMSNEAAMIALIDGPKGGAA